MLRARSSTTGTDTTILPLVGYISSDPIGLGGGLNTFGYTGQAPINQSDFAGLDNNVPSLWDHFDPGGMKRRLGIELLDQRKWVETNLPKTLSHIAEVAFQRIGKIICKNPGKSAYQGLIGGSGDHADFDVDPRNRSSNPDFNHYKDPYDLTFHHVQIGQFEVKTTDIHVQWKSPDVFDFQTLLYALDNKGGKYDYFGVLVGNRDVIFGWWLIKGE